MREHVLIQPALEARNQQAVVEAAQMERAQRVNQADQIFARLDRGEKQNKAAIMGVPRARVRNDFGIVNGLERGIDPLVDHRNFFGR